MSRFPVGSSARTILGSQTIARAMATRCCSPPDISEGLCFKREVIPSRSATTSKRCGSNPSARMCWARTMLW